MKLEWESKLIEAADVAAVDSVLATWFSYYNERRRHSSLDNESPSQYLKSRELIRR